MLTATWGLEDTRYFTLGCSNLNLVVATDHRPLLKLLGDKELADITNPRIFRLKQRTLLWDFKVVHVPGVKNPAADATSRKPSSEGEDNEPTDLDALAAVRISAVELEDGDFLEIAITSTARAASAQHLTAVTWERVKSATDSCAELSAVKACILSGFPQSRDELEEAVRPYWTFRQAIYH